MQAAATGALSPGERSYPTSEVRGRSREDPMPEEQWPRGVTPRPRSGAAAERSYPVSGVRGGGWEELPHAQRQGAARRTNRRSKELWLRERRRA